MRGHRTVNGVGGMGHLLFVGIIGGIERTFFLSSSSFSSCFSRLRMTVMTGLHWRTHASIPPRSLSSVFSLWFSSCSFTFEDGRLDSHCPSFIFTVGVLPNPALAISPNVRHSPLWTRPHDSTSLPQPSSYPWIPGRSALINPPDDVLRRGRDPRKHAQQKSSFPLF